ncbi:glycosyltransferase [Kitasatospora sp. NPDC001132]
MNRDISDLVSPLGRPLRLIVTGGGTGGHTYPALTAIRALRSRLAEVNGTLDVLWIGTATGLEAKVTAAENIPFRTVATGKIRRSANPLKLVSPANVKDMGRVPLGVAQARSAVADFGPDVMLGTGGYVAVPVGMAARMCQLGHPAGAPYDRVHVTAAVQRVPGALIEQTAPGGVILVPYGTAFCNGGLLKLTVAEDGRSASGPFVEDVAFMWVRDQRPGSGEFEIGDVRYGPSALDPAAVAEHTDAAFAIGLRLPGLFRQEVWAGYDRFGTGRFEVWDGVSYAHCRLADWDGKHAVSQSGSRSLWDEVTAAHSWWQRQGEPGLDRFGLTVTVEGEHRVWLDEPDHVVG